jgi:hypothetical protein
MTTDPIPEGGIPIAPEQIDQALSQPAPEPPMDKQWEDEALNAYRTASIDPGTSTHLRWGQGNG